MKLQFYVTDFAPNGCQDLLVIDNEGNVIDCREDAVFGLHVNERQGKLLLGDTLVEDPELRQSLMDSPDPDFCFVYKANLATIRRHIAVSPVTDGSEVEDFIQKYTRIR